MSRPVIIDKINIRYPNGWQGDPAHLARQLAEQIQQQAADLQSTQRLDFSLRAPYAGAGKQAAEQLGRQLTAQGKASGTRRRNR